MRIDKPARCPALPCPPADTRLGVTCTPDGTVFRLWSPLAGEVTLCLYPDGEDSPLVRSVPMTARPGGLWCWETPACLHGTYYRYRIRHRDTVVDAGDPYATACGVNSRRCMAVDLRRTDPEGWDRDVPPSIPPENIIYEIHIKEFSWQPAGGFPEAFRGKYKAFTCPHTSLNGDGLHPTGLDYLRDLGVTHIELMPAFDYQSVDDLDPQAFNWGYDPLYDNIPEGSYSLDPHHGEVRIREFKEMVQALHQAGFRVIMDVVYNHTYTLDSPFNQAVPGYYYRTDKTGTPSNGSGCGNDFASERPMAGRFILDSVLYWAREYHIDGFRFDLMGLLDVSLMNTIRRRLDEIYGVGEKLIFGEPWSAAPTAMAPGSLPADKAHLNLLDDRVGIFSDKIRDTIRGHVFDETIRGFVSGGEDLEEQVLNSARAWCVPGSPVKAPSQILSYISAHDNHTLWDKLGHDFPDPEARLAANKLAAAMCMTCQGSIFLLSGEEFGRTKDDHDNTYNESIALNRLDWARAWEFEDLMNYYRGLIALRKSCPGLCDKAPNHRVRDGKTAPGFVSFYVDNAGGAWDRLCIVFNRNQASVPLSLEPGSWQILCDRDSSDPRKAPLLSRSIRVPPFGPLILGRKP